MSDNDVDKVDLHVYVDYYIFPKKENFDVFLFKYNKQIAEIFKRFLKTT